MLINKSDSIKINADGNVSSPLQIDTTAAQTEGDLPRDLGVPSAAINSESWDIKEAGGDYFGGTSLSDIRVKSDAGPQPVAGFFDGKSYWETRAEGFQQNKNGSDEALNIVQTKTLDIAEDDGVVPMPVQANGYATNANSVIDNDINLADDAQHSFGFIDDDVVFSSRGEHRLETSQKPPAAEECSQRKPHCAAESSGALKTKRAIKPPSKVTFLGYAERDAGNNSNTDVRLHSASDFGAAGIKKLSPLKMPIITSSRSSSSLKGSTPVTPSRLTRGCGTPLCMAPEVSEKGVNYEAKVDVYSFGLLMYQLFHYAPLADIVRRGYGLTVQQAQSKLQLGWRPVVSSSCPEAISKIIKHCWEQDPELRPDMKHVVVQIEAFLASLPTAPYDQIGKVFRLISAPKRSVSFSTATGATTTSLLAETHQAHRRQRDVRRSTSVSSWIGKQAQRLLGSPTEPGKD